MRLTHIVTHIVIFFGVKCQPWLAIRTMLEPATARYEEKKQATETMTEHERKK